MPKYPRIIAIVVTVTLLLILSILASRVGGIAIRNDTSQDRLVPLTLASPAVRGVKVPIRWDVPDYEPDYDVLVEYRDTSHEEVLSIGRLHDAQARIVLPCVTEATSGTVRLSDRNSQRVLGQLTIDLLPAGADCVRR